MLFRSCVKDIIEYEILKKGRKVVLCGSKKDLISFDGDIFDKVLDLRGKTKIEEIPAIISKSSLVYSVDSGLFHIACLLGIPCKSFFGPIDPKSRIEGYDVSKIKTFTKKDTVEYIPCYDVGCKENKCMEFSKSEILQILEND